MTKIQNRNRNRNRNNERMTDKYKELKLMIGIIISVNVCWWFAKKKFTIGCPFECLFVCLFGVCFFLYGVVWGLNQKFFFSFGRLFFFLPSFSLLLLLLFYVWRTFHSHSKSVFVYILSFKRLNCVYPPMQLNRMMQQQLTKT